MSICNEIFEDSHLYLPKITLQKKKKKIIWQVFTIPKQPVHISVTVFYNLTKLINHLFIFTIEI